MFKMFKKFLISFLLMFSFFAAFSAAGNVLGTSYQVNLTTFNITTGQAVNGSYYNASTGLNITFLNNTWARPSNVTYLNVSNGTHNVTINFTVDNQSRIAVGFNLTLVNQSWSNRTNRGITLNISNYSSIIVAAVKQNVQIAPVKKVSKKPEAKLPQRQEFLPKGNKVKEEVQETKKQGFFEGIASWFGSLFK